MNGQDSLEFENISEVTNSTLPRAFRRGVWFTDVFILGLLALVSLYIIVTLVFYELKRNPRRGINSSALNKEENFSKRTKFLCIVTASAAHLYQIVSLATLTVEYLASNGNVTSTVNQRLNLSCKVLPRKEIFIVIVGTGLVYLFLWFRQRVFYINPSLEVLNSKVVKIISYFVLTVWIIYFFPAAIIYCILIDYHVTVPGGCMVASPSLPIYSEIIKSWVIVSILMQLALLGLFVNPILRRTMLVNLNKSLNSTKNTTSSHVAKLMQRVKKAIALTAICLMSDILAAALTLSIYTPTSNNFVFYYKINIIVNCMATIGCFDNWSSMLWPWLKKNEVSTGSSSSNTASTNQSTSDNKMDISKLSQCSSSSHQVICITATTSTQI